jgi:hypothetical protein
LAMAEYMGILGAVPFAILLLMLIEVVVRVLRSMRTTVNPYQLCIPFALVVVAGLVHAFFEDWLFAVGSYLCVFFWASAFLLIDLVPERPAKVPATASLRAPSGFFAAVPASHRLHESSFQPAER